jgi:ABC-type amino acid transport substrate-binding protein
MVPMCILILLALGVLGVAHAAAPAGGSSKRAKMALALPSEKWSGDLEGMIKRRMIRVLVVYSKTFFFVDKGTQRGVAYEAFRKFEEDLNQKLKTRHLRVNVVFIPVARDELLPALVEGRGDVAAANLTVTEGREKLVDFTDPLLTEVSEIVVAGPESPAIAAIDDLAGKEVFVRPSSSYFESLTELNARFKKEGKPEVKLKPAPENLEDEDLL